MLQAEIYRKMRKLVKRDWSSYQPATNCAWLCYLLDIMVLHKISAFSCTAGERGELQKFRKRVARAHNAAELAWDDFFSGCWFAKSSEKEHGARR
jgi:hypothetical protein